LTGEKKCPFAKECQANLSDQVLALPKKILKAKSPEFQCDMLLVRSGNDVLLQKRPSKAIWGGLWSLPESTWVPRALEAAQDSPTLKALFEKVLSGKSKSKLLKACKGLKRGQQIKHIFTHRRLWMQIWEVGALESLEVGDESLAWVNLKQLGRYGLPQPIKVLLLGLSLVRDGDLKNSTAD
jgi:A/G-specific adenine glycosylase